MPEFFETRMGHTFYDGTMPRIAKSLEQIAKQLEAASTPTLSPAAMREMGELATLINADESSSVHAGRLAALVTTMLEAKR